MQVCTLLQTDNDTNTPPLSLLQAGCPSCMLPPDQQRQSTEGIVRYVSLLLANKLKQNIFLHVKVCLLNPKR